MDGTAVEAARLSRLSPEQCRAFLDLATTQRVRPLLRHRLMQKGLDTAVPAVVSEALRNASRQNSVRNLRLYGELGRLLTALKSEGIPLVPLKGIFLAEAVYGNLGLREMNDIDVLARPADLSRIVGTATGLGYASCKDVCPDIILKGQHHLPPLVKKGHAGVEVHWNLTHPGEYFSIDPAELWERAVPVRIAGCDALALSAEDLLLHLCLHTSYQHQFAFGLRPFCDIAETITRFAPTFDWHAFLERALRWGWQRGVYLALRLAEELAGADVPAAVLERLRPEDMTEAVLETARAQVFNDRIFASPISVPCAEFLESRRLVDKIRIFWQRVFLPKAIIAVQYSVPMDSMWIYGCYPRRFVDVLRRHGHTLKRYRQGDDPQKAFVERTSRLGLWLAGAATRRE